MEFLQHLLDNSSTPFWSAFLLGIMTSISPCQLATNITAIGFISKEMEHKRQLFLSGLLYTAGRAFSYTAIGLVLYFGVSRFHVAQLFQGWGERCMGFLLIIAGLFMLDLIKISLPGSSFFANKISNPLKSNFKGAFLLGLAFALAFCPYSAVLYFGMLIPMTIGNASGLYLPVVFAIATGLPVLIIAWLLAYSVSSIGNFYNKLKMLEIWFRRTVAILFIITGIYYLSIFFIN